VQIGMFTQVNMCASMHAHLSSEGEGNDREGDGRMTEKKRNLTRKGICAGMHGIFTQVNSSMHAFLNMCEQFYAWYIYTCVNSSMHAIQHM